MKKQIRWGTLIVCIAIPLAVGAVASLLTKDNMMQFRELEQPPLAPPGWLFPVVWTILYVMMGIASYLVVTSDGNKEDIDQALTWYRIQLAVNFLWPIVFFRFELYFAAFAWLLFLWWLILKTIRAFRDVSEAAGVLLVPYLIWVTFAGYLNLGIAVLN